MEEKQDSDSSDKESKENKPDPIRNVEESGWTLAGSENYSFPLAIPPDLQLKGYDSYEYTEFKPTTNQGLPDIHIALTQSEAMAALQDLRKILHPPHDTGQGYKDPEFDLWSQGWLNGMVSMLNIFTNPQSYDI